MRGPSIILLVIALTLMLGWGEVRAQIEGRGVRVIVKTTEEPTEDILEELSDYAISIIYVFPEISAVVLSVERSSIPQLQGLPSVESVEEDQLVFALGMSSFGMGFLSWNLDIINVEKTINNGGGVYIALLDTGLVSNWRIYLPIGGVAEEYGKSFVQELVPSPVPWIGNSSHATYLASMILGYSLSGVPIEGIAPGSSLIPVKVLGDNGVGFVSDVIAGILYVTGLREELDAPIVINLSLGSPIPSDILREAIDYGLDSDVIIVAAAGDEGEAGMVWPAAYQEVISVGAIGWVKEWTVGGWWLEFINNVPEDNIEEDIYIPTFSSRERGADQELDVVAPGSWIAGPYLPGMRDRSQAQVIRWGTKDWGLPQIPGKYDFRGGTSLAAAHVSGVVAMMLQNYAGLTQGEIEDILKDTALPIDHDEATIVDAFTGDQIEVYWDDSAIGAGLIQADEAVDSAF